MWLLARVVLTAGPHEIRLLSEIFEKLEARKKAISPVWRIKMT